MEGKIYELESSMTGRHEPQNANTEENEVSVADTAVENQESAQIIIVLEENCFHHDQGHCKFGRRCKFKHAQETCPVLQKCQDSNCHYRHPKVCLYQESCWYGDGCSFHHIQTSSERARNYSLRRRCKIKPGNDLNEYFGPDEYEHESFENNEESNIESDSAGEPDTELSDESYSEGEDSSFSDDE